MDKGTMVRDLTTGSPMYQLLKFCYPFVLSNLLMQTYNIVDMLIVGRFVGTNGLAAVSIAGELALFYLFICLGFSYAGQIIISQHVGAGNRERIGIAAGTLFSFLVMLGVVITVFSLITCDSFLRIMNVPQDAFDYAHECATVYFWGMVPVFGYNIVCAILRGMGDSKRPFIFIAIASLLNIVLDIIFVVLLDMGPFGAALATDLAEATSFIVAAIYLYRKRVAFGFDFKLKSFAIDRKELRAIISLGLPMSLNNTAINASMLFISSYINAFGVIAATATAVGNKLTGIATLCTNALNTAGSSLIAQNFGAGKVERIRSTLGYMLLFGLIFCGGLALALIFFPKEIFAIFDSNPDVISFAPQFAPMGAIYLLGLTTRSASMSLINGIGFSKLSFAVGLMDGVVVRIGLSLLLGLALGMGLTGFWLGNAIANHFFGLVGGIYYKFGKWENRKRLV